ncbi:MAG: hypothetical protein KF752_11880 [Pirellulaceae bacterium]|nr:hypothetical protein [Pirellulaceae bacterium]
MAKRKRLTLTEKINALELQASSLTRQIESLKHKAEATDRIVEYISLVYGIHPRNIATVEFVQMLVATHSELKKAIRTYSQSATARMHELKFTNDFLMFLASCIKTDGQEDRPFGARFMLKRIANKFQAMYIRESSICSWEITDPMEKHVDHLRNSQ